MADAGHEHRASEADADGLNEKVQRPAESAPLVLRLVITAAAATAATAVHVRVRVDV